MPKSLLLTGSIKNPLDITGNLPKASGQLNKALAVAQRASHEQSSCWETGLQVNGCSRNGTRCLTHEDPVQGHSTGDPVCSDPAQPSRQSAALEKAMCSQAPSAPRTGFYCPGPSAAPAREAGGHR